MSLFPDSDKARKMLPLFKQLAYFPKALREMTKVSVVNNVRYNPDREPTDISWARGKSPDQLGSAFRHMMESVIDGKVFEMVPEAVAKVTGITRVYVLAEAWWRIGAALELAIEKQEALEKGESDGSGTRVPNFGPNVGPACNPLSQVPKLKIGGIGDLGHVWAGDYPFAGKEKELYRVCTKCGGIHNLPLESYVSGYFDPEPATKQRVGDGALMLYGGVQPRD